MRNNVKTCVVGSYPTKIDTHDLMQQYYSQNEVSWEKYIHSAVDEMINTGIEVISDGQTRDPIVQIFTRKLKGCRIRDRTEVIDKIKYNVPITVNDQKYVRKIIPKDKELLGLITGPFTLTKSCVDRYYHNEKEMCFDFAYALKEEIKNLEGYVDVISIDEPFFSNELPEYANEVISILTKGVRCPTRLHVCGDVSDIIPELLEIPVDILSHEFKASPQLLDVFKKYNSTKKICLGSVRSDDSRIETVEEIVAHIKKGIDVFNGNIVQLSPDCGQRFLPRNIAYQKLKNLVKAGEIVYGG